MYKLLKKSDDPKLKDFVGHTVNVHQRADGDYEGIFNNEKIVVSKDCLARSRAEEGAAELIKLFTKGRERLEKKFGTNQCISQYKLTYEGVQNDGTVGMTIYSNAGGQFLHHDAIVTLSRLYNLPYKEVFDKVAKVLSPQPDTPRPDHVEVKDETPKPETPQPKPVENPVGIAE